MKRRILAIPILLSALVTMRIAAQISTGTGNAGASGVVINQVTKQALDGVELIFESESGVSRKTTSDAYGQFTLQDIPAGRYQVRLSRTGFTNPESGGGPRRISFRPGEELTNLRFEMLTTSVVSGRALDQTRPLTSAIVVALKTQYLNGKRILAPGGLISPMVYLPFDTPVTPLVPQARVNEKGEYRISGLGPGEYYLAIWNKGPENPTADLPPIFYPGVTDIAAAVPIRVGNTEMPGLDILVPALELHIARFTLVPPTTPPFDCSQALTKVGFFMMVQHSTDLNVVHFANVARDLGSDNVASARIRQINEKTWETSKLAPGSYEIFLMPCFGRIGPQGRLTFEMGGRDLDAGTIEFPDNIVIPGRVSAALGSAVALDKVRVRLRPMDWRGFFPGFGPNPTPAGFLNPKPDGSFAFEIDRDPKGPPNRPIFGRVAPGTYQIDVGGLPPDVYVASIKYEAQEMRDSGIVVTSGSSGSLEITLGSPGASVTGTVRNNKDEIVPDTQVVLIPQTGFEGALLRTTVTDQYGAFSLGGIAPGIYLVLARNETERGISASPAFLDRFRSRATRVLLQNGSSSNLDLRVIADPN